MKTSRTNKIRVGLIGVGNWARYGHIPALQSLKDEYTITAVSSRKISTARELAQSFDIPHAFQDPQELIGHPEVDLVAVLPPAPEHAALSRMAIRAGKDVYSEWPLTTSTKDSEELLSLAEAASVRHLVGLQRRVGESARYLKDLLASGYIGDLRSVRMHVSMNYFGPVRPPALEWSLPAANFSHVLSIYGGHYFDLMFHVVGAPSTVNGILASQFPKLTLSQTGESFPNENPDAVLAQGRLISGAVYSVQIEGGKQNNSGLQIDFTGTEGDLRVTNERLYGNLTDNQIMGAQGSGKTLEVLPVPEKYKLSAASALDASVQDLVYLYAAHARKSGAGIFTPPGFLEAARLHLFIDAIGRSSDSGQTQSVDWH
jgi:predicted dehydrogenase